MPSPSKPARTKPSPKAKAAKAAPRHDVQAVVAWLERHGTQRTRDGMARYAIPSDKAFGIPIGSLRDYAKELGRSHALALALWKSGWYEARMLAAFVDEPALVTAAQMDRWAKDFDSWAVCDHACFHLFDRTPHAMLKVEQWSRRREEFVKRAAFALLASVALHEKHLDDAPLLASLALIEREASDERNFVKKAVSWALRSIGGRNLALNKAATALAKRLATSSDATERWIGKDALRDITRAAKVQRLRALAARAKTE